MRILLAAEPVDFRKGIDGLAGIWEGRKDMKDSSQWVRSTRESEWGVS